MQSEVLVVCMPLGVVLLLLLGGSRPSAARPLPALATAIRPLPRVSAESSHWKSVSQSTFGPVQPDSDSDFMSL